jgi:arsenite methyltransferase
MTESSCVKLFEQISDRAGAAMGIRPGGFDLTRRGADLAQLCAGSYVLDVGCGNGVTVGYLREKHGIHAVGIDASAKLLAQGKAREAALPITLGDAASLPFPDRVFDGLLLECSLSVVPDCTTVLGECYRVLKPSGNLIVTDLYVRNPGALKELRNLPLDSCLRGAFDKDRFLNDCMATGFALTCFEDHSGLLRDFAASMIWTYGSLDQFWSQAGRCSVDPAVVNRATRNALPGYFLFVGRKEGNQANAGMEKNS